VVYTADDLVNMADDGKRNRRKGEDEDRKGEDEDQKRVIFQRETRAGRARDKKAQKKETVQESPHLRRYEPEEVSRRQVSYILEQPSHLAGRYTQGGVGKQELLQCGQGRFRRGASEAARSGIQGAFARCAQVSVRPIPAAKDQWLC
jgi:hypothetical protein